MARTGESVRRRVREWLCQGISPRRLAFTLALGLAIGSMPLVGATTAVCAVFAVILRLNMPAIQAANYAAFPLQLALIVPFVRLGRWLLPLGRGRELAPEALLHTSAGVVATRLGAMAGEAVLAWAVVAAPAVVVLTLVLTPVLRRVPAVASEGRAAALACEEPAGETEGLP